MVNFGSTKGSAGEGTDGEKDELIQRGIIIHDSHPQLCHLMLDQIAWPCCSLGTCGALNLTRKPSAGAQEEDKIMMLL